MADLDTLINQLNTAGREPPSGIAPSSMESAPALSALINQLHQAGVLPATVSPAGEQPPPPAMAEVGTGIPSLMPNFLSGVVAPFQSIENMAAKIAPRLEPWATADRQALANYEAQGMPGAAGTVAHTIGEIAPTAALSYAIPGGGSATLLPRMA